MDGKLQWSQLEKCPSFIGAHIYNTSNAVRKESTQFIWHNGTVRLCAN